MAVPRSRVESVDILRGIIMIVMALDHVREYFGDAAANPTNLAATTVPLFFTRWVTHFCAPVFFLLTGTGAYLALRRRTKGELSRYLLTRGLWLLFLDAVALRCLGWQFNFDYQVTVLNVLWALGWSMIVLSALVHLPTRLVAAFGLVVIAGHNLFDAVRAANLGAFGSWWSVLHAPGVVFNDGRHLIFTAYPLVPWIGVTAAGYCLGPVLSWTPERRRRLLAGIGLAASLAFVVIRAINHYGEPARWSPQPTAVFTVLSFLNTTKYPPSLLFLLMTLGPALLLWAALDRGHSRWLQPALIIGKVPMFYFALHIILIHLLAVALCQIRFGGMHWMVESPDLGHFPITQPPGWPVGLPLVYLIWVSVPAALYLPCRWFARVKAGRTSWWLSYL